MKPIAEQQADLHMHLGASNSTGTELRQIVYDGTQPPLQVYANPHCRICEKCGVTSTPQWREGPNGPKTLCNACGVKRTRNLIKMDPSRRKPSKPARGADENDDGEDHPPKRSRRAYRDQLPWEQEPQRGEGGSDTQQPSRESASELSFGHNSDSAEEVAWAPNQRKWRSGNYSCPSPYTREVGNACAAAVDLLSMSIDRHPASLSQYIRSQPEDNTNDSRKIQTASFAHMANAALKRSLALPEYSEANTQLTEALSKVTPEEQQALLELKDSLDSVSQEAASAQAAVSAVAKVLAAKQAAAKEANTEVSNAARRIMKCIKDLQKKHSWKLDE